MSHSIASRTTVEVDRVVPRFHCEHSDGEVSLALGDLYDAVYLHGTLKALREFAAQLHAVVVAAEFAKSQPPIDWAEVRKLL